MKKTGSLLLVSIFAVVLLAPPGSSQSKKLTVEDVAMDVIRLNSLLKDMQRTADTRNAETKATLDQILARFSSIDSSVLKLGTSLEAIKAEDEKSSRELQEAKTAVKSIKDTLDKLELEQKLLSLTNAVTGLKKEISNLQNTPTSLPTSRQAFDSAYTLYNQGFYDDAIAEFREFLKAYPKDSRAPNAQLNIGVAYANQRKFDRAIIEFDQTIQTYPESDTKCIALYKKGLALVENKQAPEAKQILQSVQKDCPDQSGLAATALADLARKPAPARGGRGQ